ncbi:MAG: major facilitator superfamily domain-containing protein [Piptocephalis tieghemiana]|nr:MAG: major facilitator superfamily domain-containing protein [Piptocephalis tieghemiana]
MATTLTSRHSNTSGSPLLGHPEGPQEPRLVTESSPSNVRVRLALLAIALGPLSFGFHIGELNSPQAVISTCSTEPSDNPSSLHSLPECIPMPEAQYASIVAILTIGGLVGSLLAGVVSGSRKRVALINAAILLGGSLLTGLASSPAQMLYGRFLSGMGIGVVAVMAPIWLVHIAPPDLRGAFGTVNQLGIVLGILLAQVFGLYLSTPSLWRYILLFPALLALLQIFLLPLTPDSHLYPTSLGALLQPARRRALITTVSLQIGQQGSGINAVMFYSTSILSTIFPNSAALVSLLISIANVGVTLVAARILDRLGHRQLLVGSSMTTSLVLLVLAASLAFNWALTSAVAIILFVCTFAIGLGPIPFLAAPALVDPEAAGAVQSLGLAANWIGGFIIGSAFLGIRSAIGEWIWVLFSIVCVGVAFLGSIALPPSTKNPLPSDGLIPNDDDDEEGEEEEGVPQHV